MTGEDKTAEGLSALQPEVVGNGDAGGLCGGGGAGDAAVEAVGLTGAAVVGEGNVWRPRGPGDLVTLGMQIKRGRLPVGSKQERLAVAVVTEAMRAKTATRRVRLRAAKLVTEMVKINQADDHLEAKWGRIDAGKPTDSSEVKMGVSVEFIEPGKGPGSSG